MALVEVSGRFRSGRSGGGSGGGIHLLVALDGTLSDGPWVLDENLKQANALVKFSQGTADHGWNVGFTGYRATWDATDQVPQRAIASGLIDRFGFIDPHLGGSTTRLGLTGNAKFGNTEVNLFGRGERKYGQGRRSPPAARRQAPRSVRASR